MLCEDQPAHNGPLPALSEHRPTPQDHDARRNWAKVRDIRRTSAANLEEKAGLVSAVQGENLLRRRTRSFRLLHLSFKHFSSRGLKTCTRTDVGSGPSAPPALGSRKRK